MEPNTVRILLIDDDEGDHLMTRTMLEQIDGPSFELDWVATFDEAVEAFRRKEHDVYLVDYFLEDRDGLELLRTAAEMRLRRPLIMLTGRGDRSVDMEAMEAGAYDYLDKGAIDPDRLERSIRYALARSRAEDALRESEERHRGMFDHLPIGLYRCSPDGEFMDANPAMVRILGYPDPQTLQEEYSRNLYVNPADRVRFEELLQKYGVARGFETTLSRKDGSSLRVRNTARAHRSPAGEILYLEGAVEDVSDLRRAERIRGRAERFRTIFDESALAIVLVDLDGVVLDGNPAFRRIFGHDADLVGRPLSDLLDPADRAGMAEDLRSLGTERVHTVRTAERQWRAADGAKLWATVNASLVRDAEDAPDHVMLLLEDVAEAGPPSG